MKFLTALVDARAETTWSEKAWLHDEATAMRVFLLMEATDWKFLPSQLLAENSDLVEDLLELRYRKDIVKRNREGDPWND